jgi:DNA-binding CsgD family transcriptional regulator
MKWQRHELVGRRAELDALRRHGEEPALLVVRGPSGSGKTALLRRFRAEAPGLVLDLGLAEQWDEFRACALLAAVRADFEAVGGGPRVVESIEAVSRLCVRESYATPGRRHRLLGAIGALLTRIRVRLVIVVDDADRMPVAALAPMYRAGHTVVAACGQDAPRELCSLADQIIDLSPLTDDEVARLLWQAAAAPVDDAVPRALRENLGPLYGNAGTLVSTVESLWDAGRLGGVHDVLTLRSPRTPIPLPAGHRLLDEVDALGEPGRVLVRLASAEPEFRLDLIPVLARATGHPAHDYGHATDRLVRAGVLAHETGGRLRCGSRAIGAAVADEHASRRVHRAMAELLIEDDRAQAAVGHVVAAGRELPPRPELAELLGDERHHGPTGNRLARRLTRWWHTPEGPVRARLRSELVRELISAADYERLAEFVAEAVESAGERDELAAAAALAAMHLGRPVPEAVRAALTGAVDSRRPLALADRWLAGAAVRVEEVAECFGSFRGWSSVPAIGGRGQAMRSAGEPLEDACALRDLVPVLTSVLGSLYRPPTDGPVAAYHRVCRGYADGDWADALSAARELASSVDTPVARLLAAEICGWRGEDRQAAAWLAAVGEDTEFPALRCWVATGLRDHAGDGAFEYGWAWYAEHGAGMEEPGATRLLARLAAIAADSGERHRARAVLHEVRARYGPSSDTALLVRGLVEADGASLRAAERVIRKRGTRFELALACQRVARLSGEPHPWLSEAYELARSIGAAKLVSTTKRTMEGCGVAVPVRRSRNADVSDVEGRIVELIRLGKTNRQIALALRVSEKTVEKHLTRLFAKAGCRTRHGLAMSGLGARQELVGA